MRLLASWLFFLGILGGSLALAFGAATAGWHESFILPAVTALAGLVCIVAQRLFAFSESWRDYRRDVLVDLAHAVFSTGGASTVLQLAFLGFLVHASASFSAWTGFVLWPTDLPVPAQVALALVLAEFGTYWTHRLSHSTEFFWRFHALHHSSEKLYGLNSGRNHPVNVVLASLASLVPLIALGAPPLVLLLFSVFTSVHGVVQHSNVDLRLGALNWIFAGPDLHRRHHSVLVERSTTNFGSNLIVWDVVFGTRRLPEGERNDAVGLPGMAFSSNFWRHLVSPFRLKALISAPVDAVERLVEATSDFAVAAAGDESSAQAG